jgi:hypothetical protein
MRRCLGEVGAGKAIADRRDRMDALNIVLRLGGPRKGAQDGDEKVVVADIGRGIFFDVGKLVNLTWGERGWGWRVLRKKEQGARKGVTWETRGDEKGRERRRRAGQASLTEVTAVCCSVGLLDSSSSLKTLK